MRIPQHHRSILVGVLVGLFVAAMMYYGLVTQPRWTASPGTIVTAPVACGRVGCATVRTSTGPVRMTVPLHPGGRSIGTSVQVWTDGRTRTAVKPTGTEPWGPAKNVPVALAFGAVLGAFFGVFHAALADSSGSPRRRARPGTPPRASLA